MKGRDDRGTTQLGWNNQPTHTNSILRLVAPVTLRLRPKLLLFRVHLGSSRGNFIWHPSGWGFSLCPNFPVDLLSDYFPLSSLITIYELIIAKHSELSRTKTKTSQTISHQKRTQISFRFINLRQAYQRICQEALYVENHDPTS